MTNRLIDWDPSAEGIDTSSPLPSPSTAAFINKFSLSTRSWKRKINKQKNASQCAVQFLRRCETPKPNRRLPNLAYFVALHKTLSGFSWTDIPMIMIMALGWFDWFGWRWCCSLARSIDWPPRKVPFCIEWQQQQIYMMTFFVQKSFDDFVHLYGKLIKRKYFHLFVWQTSHK